MSSTFPRSDAWSARDRRTCAEYLGLSAERVLPSIRNVIGTLLTPRFLPISGVMVAQQHHQPVLPRIAARASVCPIVRTLIDISGLRPVSVSHDAGRVKNNQNVESIERRCHRSGRSRCGRSAARCRTLRSVARSAGQLADTRHGHTMLQLQFSK